MSILTLALLFGAIVLGTLLGSYMYAQTVVWYHQNLGLSERGATHCLLLGLLTVLCIVVGIGALVVSDAVMQAAFETADGMVRAVE